MSVYSSNQYTESDPNSAWTKLFGFVPSGARVLDIGCSSGQLGAALRREKQAYVVGVDIDKNDVELAKRNLDKAYVLNAEREDFAKLGKFDVIIFADVIEHLVDPVATLKRAKRQLSKGGRIIFSIPNMANVTTRLELLGGRFEYKDFGLLDRTHLHFYDRQEVESVFGQAGLRIVATDCTLREVPDKLLKPALAKFGITLTPKLRKHLSSEDARIYQFIGYSVPGDGTAFRPQTSSPLDVISQSMDEQEAYYHELLAEKADEATEAQQQLAQLQDELNSIYNSRGWKLLQKARRLKAFILRQPHP